MNEQNDRGFRTVDQAFDEIRRTPVPEGPSRGVIARVLGAAELATEEPLVRPRPFRKRSFISHTITSIRDCKNGTPSF